MLAAADTIIRSAVVVPEPNAPNRARFPRVRSQRNGVRRWSAGSSTTPTAPGSSTSRSSTGSGGSHGR